MVYGPGRRDNMLHAPVIYRGRACDAPMVRGDGGSLLPKSAERMGAALEVAVRPSSSRSSCEDNVAGERALGKARA